MRYQLYGSIIYSNLADCFLPLSNKAQHRNVSIFHFSFDESHFSNLSRPISNTNEWGFVAAPTTRRSGVQPSPAKVRPARLFSIPSWKIYAVVSRHAKRRVGMTAASNSHASFYRDFAHCWHMSVRVASFTLALSFGFSNSWERGRRTFDANVFGQLEMFSRESCFWRWFRNFF